MLIVLAPNSVLSQVAKPIAKVDSYILNLIGEMKKTLSETKDPEGVGLAASQVGKSLRLFIAKPNPKSKVQIFINPEIVEHTARGDRNEGMEPAAGDSSGGTDEGVRLLDRRGVQRRASSFERMRLEGAPLDEREAGPASVAGPKAPVESGTKLEGCLSLPTIWGTVKREKNITLKFKDEKGHTRTKTFSGLLATIVQHELDHLNGILFPRRVLEQKSKLYKSKKDKKGEEIFQELDL